MTIYAFSYNIKNKYFALTKPNPKESDMTKNFEPSNVDLLNIGNNCNLNCQQCYYKEEQILETSLEQELFLAGKLIKTFSNSSIFIYPKEITTSMDIVHLLPRVNQKSVLSNGIMLSEEIIDHIINNGVKEIKVTFFASYQEHSFFNRIDNEQYKKIIKNLELCKHRGLAVTVNTILSKVTNFSINELAQKCYDLGVDRIEFLRLKPVGNATSINRDVMIGEKDMLNIVHTVETCKRKYPGLYFRYNLSCGPDFYGKTFEQAAKKISKASEEWTKSKYLCPSIDGNYLGISLKTGNIYSCFFAMGHKEFMIGKIDLKSGDIIYLRDYILDSKLLSNQLSGNCHIDNCKYQKICLGGCRSTAFLFAKTRGESNPMFAGMDLCVTKCKEKLNL